VAKGCLNGATVRYMMVNGETAKRMGVGCGKVYKVILILVNGKIVRSKDSVCFLWKMGPGTKESSKTLWNMEWVHKDFTIMKLM